MSNGMYSPSPDPFLQFRDAQGAPLAGGQLFTYVAGTTSPQLTYSDVGLTVPNPNPIVLQSDGTNPQGPIFLVPGWSYRYVLQDAQGNTIWTRDNIMVESGTGGTPPPTGPSSLVDQGAPAVDANSWPMHVVGPVTVAQPVEVVGVATGTPLPVTGTVAVSQPVLVNQGAPATAANAWPTTVLGQVIVSQGNPNAAVNAWPVVVTQQPVGVNLVSPATVPVSGTVNQGAPTVNANAWPVTIASGAGPGGVVQISGPVTMSDGANVTQGYLNDVAAPSASGSFSLNSVLKGILSRLISGITANQGTPASTANAWPVAIVSGGSGGGGGAVTVADGADVTQGSQADPLATSTTGSWSTISLLKGLLGRLSGTGGVVVNQGLSTDGNAWYVRQGSASNPWIVQPVAGSQIAIVGSVTVGNFPATQPISGSVSVGNFPSTQPVSGTVSVGNFPATQPISGTVSVVQPVQVGPVAGSPLSVTFPSTQQVSVQNTVVVNQGLPGTDANSWSVHQAPTPGLQRLSVSATGVGDNILVTGSSGHSIYIYRFIGIATAAMAIFFKDGASSGLTGVMDLIANQQFLLEKSGDPWFVTTAGNSFLINVSTGATLAGAIWFTVV